MHQQTASLIVVSAVMPFIALTAVILRVVARFIRKTPGAKLNASDYLIFVALTLTIALGISSIAGAAYAQIGEPVDEQSPAQFESFLKVLFADTLFYIWSVGFVKLSVLAFYRSVFSFKKFQLVCDVVSGIAALWLAGMFLGFLLRGHPISVNWNPTQPGASQGNIKVLFPFIAASDVLVDLIILCLPALAIRNLHMNTNKKILIAGVFGLGAFCIVSATVRLAYIIKFVYSYNGVSTEYSTLVVNNLIWLTVEPAASVIAACLPTLGPLLSGVRSPGSIVGSIRSVLSIRSQSSKEGMNTAGKTSHETASEIELVPVDPHYNSNDHGRHTTDISTPRYGVGDIESQHENAGIHVVRETDVHVHSPGA